MDLGPFEERLNVVHAPNARGKSTVFEAMRSGLLDSHKVTGRDVEDIRPWGRSLAPKVIVEFTHEGVDYRIAKQFLDNASALLERREAGQYRRLAERDSADDEVRKILTKNPPGRGLARIENWGLAQVLWAPQGSLALQPLSGDVVGDIRSMLGAQVGGAGSGPIERRIEEKYLEFFTPKGKLKAGKEAPLLARLQQQLEEAREAHRKVHDLYVACEESVRRVEDLHARRDQARRDAEELSRHLQAARKDAETCKGLHSEREQRFQQERAAEAQYKRLRKQVDDIGETEKELLKIRQIAAALEAELPLKETEAADRGDAAEKGTIALKQARKERADAEEAEKVASDAKRFAESQKKISELDALLGRVGDLQARLEEIKCARAAVVAPDAETLRKVRKVIKERDDTFLRIEQSLITLEVVPEKKGVIEVLEGEPTGQTKLAAGKAVKLKGSPAVVANIRGVGRLRASGPAGSIEKYREALAKAQKKLAKLTEAFATCDADELEHLREKAGKLHAELAEMETQVQTLLSDRSVEDIIKEKALHEAVVSRTAEAHPGWRKSPPEVDALETEAEELKKKSASAVQEAETAWNKAISARAASISQLETLSRRLEDTRKQCGDLDRRLSELASDGRQPAERQKQLEQLAMEWEACRARLGEIDVKLAAFGDDPGAVVEKFESQLEAANGEVEKAREEELREQAKLESLSAQGPYSEMAVAEEKVAQLEREVQSEQLRVDAVRLLYETVAKCRSEAVAAVAGPVETAATRILQRIAGLRPGRIQVGENFAPCSVVPDAITESIALENLSGGEQEQLYLATRLALAGVLRTDERQLVVLDDVLTATDAGRLARVMGVLEDAAERLQILVLTCHPERYRGLKAASFFDLENIRTKDKEGR